jgi:hypothetical protein
MLSQTRLTEKTRQAVQATITEQGWALSEVTSKLQQIMNVLEARNRKIAEAWLHSLMP